MTACAKSVLWATAGATLAFVLILASQPQAIAGLQIAWGTEEYSHGVLIPFIALLLACNLLAAKPPVLRPSWFGLPFLLAAALLLLTSRLSAFDMAAQFGLIAAVAGIVLGFFGRAAARTSTPAIVYLVFAIPLPHLVQANLSQSLQLISSTLGVKLLELCGIPVFQQGNIIDLGSYQLQVVEACSGLRYLFPLMSFGYLLAFLLEDRLWKRLVIFLSTIPITLVLNAIRIAFIGITVDRWGRGMAEGFVHGFEGWTVFLICTGVLMAEIWLLRRIGTHGRFRYDYLGLPRPPYFSGALRRLAPALAALLFAGLMAVFFGSGVIDTRKEVIPDHAPLASFPLTLGAWRGVQEQLSPDVLQQLQLNDYLMNDYRRDTDGVPVNFYIAYYASQRVGSTTHSPSNCIPGGGWQIENSRVQTVALPGEKSLNVTRLIIRKGDAAEIVYYWFDERGRNLTENYAAKWYLLIDSLTMHRTDGALIRVLTPIAAGETEAAAETRLQDFLALSLPAAKTFIPGPPGNK